MADEINTETADTNPAKTVVQLPAFPENTNIRIYVDGKDGGVKDDGFSSHNHEPLPHEAPDDTHPVVYSRDGWTMRGVRTAITGAIGAIAGYMGGHLYVNNKMFDFDAEVAKRTQDNIMGRRGIGAATAETSSLGGLGNLGSMGPGMASHEIRYNNAMAVAKEGNHPFAKFIYTKLGGDKGLIPLAIAAAVGTVAAGIAYVSIRPRKSEIDIDAGADDTVKTPDPQKTTLLRHENPLSPVQDAGIVAPSDREATDLPRHHHGVKRPAQRDTGSHTMGTHGMSQHHLDHQDHDDHHRHHEHREDQLRADAQTQDAPTHSPEQPTTEPLHTQAVGMA